MLPKSVPSLFGGFPESLREELQGFLSDPDWEEGRNRPAIEYAKVAQSPVMSGIKEDDFRWAYAVCPAASPPRNNEAAFTRGSLDWFLLHPSSRESKLKFQCHSLCTAVLHTAAEAYTLHTSQACSFMSSEQRAVLLGDRCRPRGRLVAAGGQLQGFGINHWCYNHWYHIKAKAHADPCASAGHDQPWRLAPDPWSRA